MAKPFVPKDSIDIVQAALRLAARRNASRWDYSTMHPTEREIYEGLGPGRSYNAELIDSHLTVLIPANERAENPNLLDRRCDFLDAVDELQQALFAEELGARFVDENGQHGMIPGAVWGSSRGKQFMLSGVVWMDDGPLHEVSRGAILKIEDLENLGLPSDVRGAHGVPSSQSMAKRYSKAKAKAELLEFHASRHPDITTFAEDWAFFQTKNYPRKLLEIIRRDPDVAKRARGQKRPG